jgi:hypothetical protein
MPLSKVTDHDVEVISTSNLKPSSTLHVALPDPPSSNTSASENIEMSNKIRNSGCTEAVVNSAALAPRPKAFRFRERLQFAACCWYVCLSLQYQTIFYLQLPKQVFIPRWVE